MNPNVDAHPPAEQLRAFALGELSPSESSVVERHVSECESCCESLRSVPDDSLMDQLQGMTVGLDQAEPSKPTVGGLPAELNVHPRYRVLSRLGEGGMGVVYKAEHRIMERTIALKVISPKFVKNQQAVARFHREVRAAATLDHPNIVTAHDAEQAGGLHFLAMEYVDGASLAKLVQKKGPLPVKMACDFIRQTALGLQHAHEHGMVHRDIKPQNLMVTKKGRIKILDFGLARLASESEQADTTGPARALTAVGMVVGTPDFLAPEQARCAREIDIRADLYSLGCTFYFLLTGRVPFPTGSGVEKLFQHCEDDPEPLEEIRDKVPANVVAIVNKLMAKSPEDRFSTPTEVVAALDESKPAKTAKVAPVIIDVPEGESPDSKFLDTPNPPVDTLIVAETPKRPRQRPSAFRNPWLWGAGALLVGLVVLAVALWKGQGDPDKNPAGTPPSKRLRVVYLLASNKFWYPDYGPVVAELRRAGVEVVVASTRTDRAVAILLNGQPGREVKPDVLVADVKADEFDGLIVGGGPGALDEFTGDSSAAATAHALIREMLKQDKLVSAICMGPRVLLDAGVLEGRSVTCYSDVRADIERSGITVVNKPLEESDGIITARNDKSAKVFAEAILHKMGK